MDDISRVKNLIIAMRLIGVFFIFAIYPLMTWIWPSGWGWTPRQPEYERIIAGAFATLGVFLVIGSKYPLKYINLIWFTIWLNLVYATIMLLMVAVDRSGEENLFGNIPVQYLIAGILWYFIPKNIRRLKKILYGVR
ncbi:DUF6632 domain-containing protein [Microbulbifer spongiae]|uniref:Uncharacterized protein n=1 Tax=Microbulbifer spongiae TaxID=2944933 RepID=A0ABY9EAM8_9GAMM|nr:DUF6632 domain-containing protein [Microbulbifer sp. MI-G]WKD48961.1 hypothetical protein M8T91_13810 [Microbulbifer sp. MI-G]